MTVLESFVTLQSVVDADAKVVQLARDRRDVFKSALLTAPDSGRGRLGGMVDGDR